MTGQACEDPFQKGCDHGQLARLPGDTVAFPKSKTSIRSRAAKSVSTPERHWHHPSPWGEPHHPAEVCTQRWVLGAAWLLKKSSCASCHHRGHESPEVSCLSLPSLSPSPLLSSSTQNWPQSDLSCNSLHAPVSLTMEARQNPVVWGMLHSWPPPVAPTPLRSRAKLPPAPSCGFAGPRAQRTTCPQM